MNRRNKNIAYCIGILSIIASGLLYMKWQYIGFPDGHLTELDRAEKPMFLIMCLVFFASGLFLLYLAKSAKRINSNIIFYRILIFLFAAILIAVSLDMYFTSNLENGGGG